MCDLGSADGDGSGCQAALVANQALGLAVARGALLRALEDAGGRAIAAALAEGVAAGDLGGVRVGQAGRPGDISFDLTNAHIPPQRGSGGQSGYAMYASQGGSVAKLQGVGGGGGGGRGIRGAAMFSNDSRRRCLQVLGSVDKRGSAPPLFVGLTYPAVWPDDPAVWNDHLDSFYKRLCRKYPWANIAVIWRKEPQERGAPHFHLFVFGLNYLPYQWVGENWAEISNGNARSCSRVERVRSWRGAMFYASKYLAKPTADGVGFTTATGTPLPEVGRHRGLVRYHCYGQRLVGN